MKEIVVETFNECFEREFFKVLKYKKNKTGQKLVNLFINNDFVKNWDYDFLLKDKINDDKNKIIEILNTKEKNFKNFFEKITSIEIKKEYLNTFVISYNIGVQFTSSVNSSDFGSKSNPAPGFRSQIFIKREDITNNDLLLNFNKIDNFSDININLLDSIQEHPDKDYIIKNSKARVNSLLKYIKKLVAKNVNLIEKNCYAYYASLKIYSLNITHVLIPVYKVKLIKEGFDYKYKINGFTFECDRYFLI